MATLGDHGKRALNFSVGRGYRTNSERRQERAAKRQTARDKIYTDATIPDEEQVRRNERRKAAKRRGSRQRNVLTDDEDTLG